MSDPHGPDSAATRAYGLRLHRPVIDLPGPVGPGCEVGARPDAQAASQYRQTGLGISGNLNVIDVEILLVLSHKRPTWRWLP